MAIETQEQLRQYIRVIEAERDSRPAEAALVDEIKRLREAVRSHRAEILHGHLRWPDYGLGDGPQIVSADRALWTAAGVEDDHPYEDEPITRLHGLVDRFRDALELVRKQAASYQGDEADPLRSDVMLTVDRAMGLRR